MRDENSCDHSTWCVIMTTSNIHVHACVHVYKHVYTLHTHTHTQHHYETKRTRIVCFSMHVYKCGSVWVVNYYIYTCIRVECAKAIEWAKEGSAALCFLSLQGDKYGYQMLPKSLPKDDVDFHLQVTKCSEEVKKIIFNWYIVDENAVPYQYVLRNLENKDDAVFWSQHHVMLVALNNILIDQGSYPGTGLRVGQSVTEWEVRAALGGSISSSTTDQDREMRASRLCWSHRQLAGVVDDRSYRDTTDDVTLESRLHDLKSMMLQEFPQTCVQTYSSELTLADIISTDEPNTVKRAQYFSQFKEFSTTKLSQALQRVIESKKKWRDDALGLGMSGAAAEEILHHLEWAYTKCATFCGRDRLVQKVLAFVKAENRQDMSVYSGIAGCVIGVSGAGA